MDTAEGIKKGGIQTHRDDGMRGAVLTVLENTNFGGNLETWHTSELRRYVYGLQLKKEEDLSSLGRRPVGELPIVIMEEKSALYSFNIHCQYL